MKKFRTWLTEAISAGASDAVNKIIQKYLQRKLGGKVYKMPGVEEYKNSTGRGYGVRYFYYPKNSVRFNWKGANISAFTLDSVDVWDGTGTGGNNGPQWHMDFDGQVSLVKTLPTIVDLLKSGFGTGTFWAIPDGLNENSNLDDYIEDDLILENVNKKDHFDLMMPYIKPNAPVPVAEITKKVGQKAWVILNGIRQSNQFGGLFKKEGKTVTFIGTQNDLVAIQNAKPSILKSEKVGAVEITITPGPAKEVYAPLKGEEQIEAEGGIERVSFQESLEHLDILVKFVVKGRSNALFVAGKGGTGKTTVVEKALAKFGFTDGNGYKKIAGSASPVGMYKLFFDNKDGIILFDDADTALADQEGRNLMKAATDTQKVRKLSWNKMGSGIVTVAKYEASLASSEEGDDEGKVYYPNTFEFSGRVIVISNLKINKLDPDGALRTRGYMIDIDPTDAELIDHMRKIAKKIQLEGGNFADDAMAEEVIKYLETSKNKQDVNLRKLVRGLNMKDEMGNDPKAEIMIRLYA